MVFNRFGVVIKAQMLMETDYRRQHTGKYIFWNRIMLYLNLCICVPVLLIRLKSQDCVQKYLAQYLWSLTFYKQPVFPSEVAYRHTILFLQTRRGAATVAKLSNFVSVL